MSHEGERLPLIKNGRINSEEEISSPYYTNIQYKDEPINEYYQDFISDKVELGNDDIAPTETVTRPRKSTVVRGRVRSPKEDEHKSHFASDVESLNYVVYESDINFKHQKQRSKTETRLDDVRRWLTVILIGTFTAIAAYTVHFFVEKIFEIKFMLMEKYVRFHSHNLVHIGFLIFLLSNMLLVLIASVIVVFIWPYAGGSGIPEVKSYLNGVRIPKALNIFTLVSKLVSVICAVSASLPVGPEGPLIHIGAMIGGGFAEWKSRTFRCALPLMENFRNSRDRRDFISSGAAAGIAAAFGSPIGGVLFALEEASSHWSQALTWRTFFGTMTATFVVNLFLSVIYEGRFNVISTVIFDVGQSQGFTMYEFPLFVFLGVIGGVLGSIFTWTNIKVSQLRSKFLHRTKLFRMIEVILITTACSAVWFYICFLATCREKNDAQQVKQSLVSFTCTSSSYNEYASLFLVPPENAVRHLFGRGSATEFGLASTGVFAAIYLIFACYTAGTSMATGLFVPMIIVGAAYGRFFGIVCKLIFPSLELDPGTYALIGASSFMGGVTRMTISLTVILLEITNDMQYLLPIMLTLLISKWTGDLFTKPLYDAQIEVKHIPLLENEPNFEMTKLRNESIMQQNVRCLHTQSQISTIIEYLTTTTHHGFPVLESQESPVFVGMISRSYLLLILKYIVIKKRVELTQKEIQHYLEDLPRIELHSLLNRIPHEEQVVDLEPFMNRSTLTVSELTTVSTTFELFRSMSLRHLPVVNRKNHVVGFITRKDLMHERIEEIYQKNKHTIKPPKLLYRFRQ